MASGELAVREPTDADVELTRRALEVLDANWIGHATQPSPLLYPHQWSWDSACIAIGRAPHDQPRAETELRSLFAGQWRNGLLPHIVFTDGGSYFPGPEFWQTERSADAPDRRTSGIVQPPIHATAALHVHRHASDPERATAFLAELLPKLAAWHDYLYRERVRGDDGLVEIWHPWEAGMDNSPLWDDALARIELTPDQVPDYARVDIELNDPSERPTDGEYDRYAYLVKLFRDLRYEPRDLRDATPFAVRPVLFNSLLVQANRDLVEIARVVGANPARFEDWAGLTARGLETMWDEAQGQYADWDVRAGEHVRTRVATGFAPLYAGVPTPARAARMAQGLAAAGMQVVDGGLAMPTLSPEDPRFQPNLYWRGPMWPILNWVLYRGLVRYGFRELAGQLRMAVVELTRRHGFWEHYSPTTGEGHGGEQFAWTAALVLAFLHDRPEANGQRRDGQAAQRRPSNTERS